MNNMLKNLVIWLVIGLVLMTVFNQFNQRQATQGMVEYSEFLDEVKAGRFRDDLYFRINVLTISLPPLRGWGPLAPQHPWK